MYSCTYTRAPLDHAAYCFDNFSVFKKSKSNKTCLKQLYIYIYVCGPFPFVYVPSPSGSQPWYAHTNGPL